MENGQDGDDEEKCESNMDSFSCNNGCDLEEFKLEIDDALDYKSTYNKTQNKVVNIGGEEYIVNSTETMNSNENLNFKNSARTIINNNNQDKNSNNSISPASKKIVSNSSSSEAIGFKDIEKRLKGTYHVFKSNEEIEAREGKIKGDMHKNKNGRSKNSADNIHTKAQRGIINYSLRDSINLSLEEKKIGVKLKKLSNRIMENSKQKKLKELMGKKLKDILTEDGENKHNEDIIVKYLSDSPILELTLGEYLSYVVYETEDLNVDEEIKSKIIRADKILKKFKEKDPKNLDQEYYYKFLYHLFNFNWYIENIKGREKDYKQRHKSNEKKK